MKKDLNQWFEEYGESHQNPKNKMIHWVCVPTIFFCVVAFLSLLPLPNPFAFQLSVAHVVIFFAALFYVRLSWKLAIAAIAFALLCLQISLKIQAMGYPLGLLALGLFILAWIGQFIGHHIEGKKPSFLKDLQFLLIGPLWLLGFVYKRLGIGY